MFLEYSKIFIEIFILYMKLVISESQLKKIIEQSVVGAPDYGVYNDVQKDTNNMVSSEDILPFSEKNLAQELKKQGVMYPDVAMAQSMLETGYFKSDIFLYNNNLFGMRQPKKRRTLSKGPNRGHASFDNWQDSVSDYKMWQDYNKLSNLSKDQYVAKLNRIYCMPPSCGSNNYAKKVMSLLSKASSSFS